MKEEFDNWFYELEGFHIRAERFWGDYESKDRDVMIEWMRTAYQMGYENGQQLYGGTE
jgi:hypothetical protein